MGNEQVRQTSFFLYFPHQIHYLRLCGNIQGADAFIRDNQLRLHNHGSGNAYPLPLSAGKHMRVTLRLFF